MAAFSDRQSAAQPEMAGLKAGGRPLKAVPYRSDVGIDVNAAPLKRNPSAARFPELTVKSTEPILPTTPARPGISRKALAVFVFAAREIVPLPIELPWLSRARRRDGRVRGSRLTRATPV